MNCRSENSDKQVSSSDWCAPVSLLLVDDEPGLNGTTSSSSSVRGRPGRCDSYSRCVVVFQTDGRHVRRVMLTIINRSLRVVSCACCAGSVCCPARAAAAIAALPIPFLPAGYYCINCTP